MSHLPATSYGNWQHLYDFDIFEVMQSGERQQMLLDQGKPIVADGPYLANFFVLALYTLNVCNAWKFNRTTICLARTFTHMVFAKPEFNAEDRQPSFQLIVLACVMIAAKANEVPMQMPYLQDFVAASNYVYSEDDLTDMELSILKTLNWRILRVTPNCFLEYYIQHASLGSQPRDHQLKVIAMLALDWSFTYSRFVPLLPSKQASIVLKVARAIVSQGSQQMGDNGDHVWGQAMVNLTGYDLCDQESQDCCGLLTRRYFSLPVLLHGTPDCFLQYYLKHASLGFQPQDRGVKRIAKLVLVWTDQYPEMLPLMPPKRASIALQVARTIVCQMTGRNDAWNSAMVELTGYDLTDEDFRANCQLLHLRYCSASQPFNDRNELEADAFYSD